MTTNTRLQETLGRAELARLVQRLRTRIERGRPLSGQVILPNATPAERDAVNRLLGRPPSRSSKVTISLEQLDEKLRRAGLCMSLSEAVQSLTGPIRNLRAEGEALELKWEKIFADASESIKTRPELAAWLDDLRATGLLRRYGVEKAEQVVSDALIVLSRLPAKGIPLAELAATSTGDAHALDPDMQLGVIVIRAAASLGGIDRWDDAESRRDAWASIGVLCDELSAPVLVLNLRINGNSSTDRAMRVYADAGEPYFLSTRQLLRTPPRFDADQTHTVFVCENPSVVAAAANQLGAASAPLVCVGGLPCTAARILLNQLQQLRVPILYHGDFDWPGIQIANIIMRRHRATPWRMRSEDYRRCAIGSHELSGATVPADWDGELMGLMKQIGKAIHEEQVLKDLLDDLRSH